MAEITIYTTPVCPYCDRAKRLLKEKGQQWNEIDVSKDAAVREKMMEKAGGKRSVPQIFIGEKHIGGCDDLYALDKQGGLDSLLS